jgi:hypothetical protein
MVGVAAGVTTLPVGRLVGFQRASSLHPSAWRRVQYQPAFVLQEAFSGAFDGYQFSVVGGRFAGVVAWFAGIRRALNLVPLSVFGFRYSVFVVVIRFAGILPAL